MGIKNVMPGTVVQADGEARVECAIGTLAVPAAQEGGKVLVLIDERRVALSPMQPSGSQEASGLDGAVGSRRFLSGEIEIVVRVDRGTLTCLLQPDRAGPAVGDQVSVLIPPDAIRLVHHP